MKIPEFPKAREIKENEFQYATFIDHRSPQFKIHRHLGNAHAAINCKVHKPWRAELFQADEDMVLYHKEDGEWKDIFVLEKNQQFTKLPWWVES